MACFSNRNGASYLQFMARRSYSRIIFVIYPVDIFLALKIFPSPGLQFLSVWLASVSCPTLFTAQSIKTQKLSDDSQKVFQNLSFCRCGLNVCGERCARMEVHQVNLDNTQTNTQGQTNTKDKQRQTNTHDKQRQTNTQAHKDRQRQTKTDNDRQTHKTDKDRQQQTKTDTTQTNTQRQSKTGKDRQRQTRCGQG